MAQLTIKFDRDTLSDSFYLGVDVLAAAAVSAVCIVARKGMGTSLESVTRIATLNDLVGIPAAPVVDGYNHFYCEEFDTITPVPGDQIRLDVTPSLWVYLGYAPATWHTVLSYDAAYKVVKVAVGSEFPAYGGRLSFSLYDSGTSLRGVFVQAGAATLDLYSGAWDNEIYYRLQTIHTAIEQLQDAINKFFALQTEAQALVDNTELNLDDYAGSSTEIYT